MGYYFHTKRKGISFDEGKILLEEALKEEGFGIVSEIDLKATFKKKIDQDFRQYTILGACNPKYAFEAVSTEANIGVFLPCNFIIQEKDNGTVDFSAIDPVASMGAVKNSDLENIGSINRQKIENIIRKVEG